ncbi:MAG: amidohydrolase family protein [Gemmatimonadota bacterium]
MRVIDFHTHPWRPEELAPGTAAFIRRISPAVKEHGDRLTDPRFAADLLRAEGVERAVVLAEHCPATSGNVRTRTVIEHCRRVPDFYLPFACVNPNVDPDPAGLLRRWIDEAPIAGLKLYPSYQFFYPNEPRLYPVYAVCQEHGLPVLFHVGSSTLPGTRLKYCDPIHLDDLGVDFPDLVVVMAHGGRGLWYDACALLARQRRNFYIDVSGLVPSRLEEHFPNLEALADKVVFGSDWPAMPKSVRHNADAIAALDLSSEAVEKILHGNASQLLGLEPSPAARPHGAAPRG